MTWARSRERAGVAAPPLEALPVKRLFRLLLTLPPAQPLSTAFRA